MRSWFVKSLAVAAFTAAAASLAYAAAPLQPAVVYGMGGKFDKSFNEGLYRGIERFKKETGAAYVEFEITNDAVRAGGLSPFSRNTTAPRSSASAFADRGRHHRRAGLPQRPFHADRLTIRLPNVQAVQFREEEGSFLVGVLAALASKTHKIGFVGGMDVPLIRRFACGYSQGIHYTDPSAQLIQSMAGTTPAAWTDPARGGELARQQFDRGVDVVYAAAGATGMGVLQAAADAHKYGIGVDSNQNYLHPGTMLTSMIKRVDNAVYDSFTQVKNGSWKAGVTSKGLKEGGVDWALDANNRALVTPAIEQRVLDARKGIIDGKIKVIDYRVANSFPV